MHRQSPSAHSSRNRHLPGSLDTNSPAHGGYGLLSYELEDSIRGHVQKGVKSTAEAFNRILEFYLLENVTQVRETNG